MTDTEKRLRDIVYLCALMRDAQKRYFKDRTRENLIASKERERRVDEALKELADTK